MKTKLQILVENHQNLLEVNTKTVLPVIESVLALEGFSCDEINIYFVDEKTICSLHNQHFNDPSPTDCISIHVDPIGSSPCFLGEIYISPKAAIDYCADQKESLYQELTLYLVHGILHLLGYDDIDEKDREKMRVAEKRNMDYLLLNKKLISK